MPVDRSVIRVKAMLIAPNAAGTHHLVSRNPASIENPQGFDRLIGGSVELGETMHDAIVREVHEELGARVVGLTQVGVVENFFRFDGALGHEIVAVFTGTLEPELGADGGMLTESDGSVVPVVWRRFEDAAVEVPLYPVGALELARRTLA